MESIPMTIIIIVAIPKIVAFRLPKRQTGYTSEMLRQMSVTNMVNTTTMWHKTCTRTAHP